MTNTQKNQKVETMWVRVTKGGKVKPILHFTKDDAFWGTRAGDRAIPVIIDHSKAEGRDK